ncbi:unnamed protein product [Rotaria magnacalcarata]
MSKVLSQTRKTRRKEKFICLIHSTKFFFYITHESNFISELLPLLFFRQKRRTTKYDCHNQITVLENHCYSPERKFNTPEFNQKHNNIH